MRNLDLKQVCIRVHLYDMKVIRHCEKGKGSKGRDEEQTRINESRGVCV